ncbi:MAG: EthD domain-containing protein [Rhizomicrobium sp.]
MYKVMFLLKRKSHMTHEQFREHFERSHAPMAQKYCGHLFSEYRRSYMNVVWTGGDSRKEGSGYGPREWEWDLLSEWILPSEENFHEIQRIMESPGIKHLFEEDEDRFIDRDATVMIPCIVADTGTRGTSRD